MKGFALFPWFGNQKKKLTTRKHFLVVFSGPFIFLCLGSVTSFVVFIFAVCEGELLACPGC